jgi:hypothetical protein
MLAFNPALIGLTARGDATRIRPFRPTARGHRRHEGGVVGLVLHDAPGGMGRGGAETRNGEPASRRVQADQRGAIGRILGIDLPPGGAGGSGDRSIIWTTSRPA